MQRLVVTRTHRLHAQPFRARAQTLVCESVRPAATEIDLTAIADASRLFPTPQPRPLVTLHPSAVGRPGAVSAADFPHPTRPDPFPHEILTIATKPYTNTPTWLRPIMLAFLAEAILLLAAAALPQRVLANGRAAAVLERRRLALALVGIGLVIAIAVAALLS